MIIPKTIINQIKDHASQHPGEEVCGYAFLKEQFIYPVDNHDTNRADNFRIDPDQHLSIVETFRNPVIYHTHHAEEQPATLSDHDVIASKALRIPYLLVHTKYDQIDYYDPNNLDPFPLMNRTATPRQIEFYTGLPWSFERWDCYALLRTFYKGFLGIELRDYSRGADPSSVCDPDWNLYLANYEREGFRKLDSDEPLQDYDVVLMNLIGNNVHHAAVLLDAKKRTGLHVTCNQNENTGEVIPQLSTTFVYGYRGYWVERTRLVIRHQSLENNL